MKIPTGPYSPTAFLQPHLPYQPDSSVGAACSCCVLIDKFFLIIDSLTAYFSRHFVMSLYCYTLVCVPVNSIKHPSHSHVKQYKTAWSS